MRVFILLVIMALVASFPFVSSYIGPKNNKLTHDQQYVYEVIDSYLKDHPDRIMKALQEHSVAQHQAKQDQKIKEIMVTHAENINNDKYPSFGKGIKVIEFFDYNCGHCKTMQPIIKEILKEEGVEYIFRELPLFGKKSELPTYAALSVYLIDKDKYLPFNEALLKYKAEYNDHVIADIVTGLGIDIVEFNKVKSGPEVQQLIKESIALFQSIGTGGTPTFIIGDELIAGAIDLQTFKDKINQAKSAH